MLNSRIDSLVVVLLAGASWLGACSTTRVVIADPDRGEQTGGERFVRLQLNRSKLMAEKVDPQLCFDCSIEGPQGAETKTVGFQLQFLAVNELSRPWDLSSSSFQLTSIEHLDRDFQPVHEERVLASVPPYSTARFAVVLTIRGTSGFSSESQLFGSYVLDFEDEYVSGNGSTRPVRLVRHLAVGEYNQTSQILRFAGFATLGLVALAAI